MRLITFTTHGTPKLGAQIDGHAVDLPGTYAAWHRTRATDGALGDAAALEPAAFPTSMLDLLRAGESARAAAAQALAFAAEGDTLAALVRVGLAHPLEAVTYLPPLPRPGKIICLGHNYRRHVIEMGNALPTHPVIFAKFANTLVGHRQPIVLPRVSTRVDYEGELAIVIGRSGKDIAPEAAFDHIAGYTIFNDVSVRDYQHRTPQWLQGKTFDGAGPMGPALVTLDEIRSPEALDLTLRLNGEVMQQANTADFIFDIPTVIQYLTQIMTLEPGDVISTGTPGGVGDARDPQVYLKPGDRVEVEIAELGTLENPVVAPS
jgi:acylpyruvate hydrolase